ncbi:MAG: hypothetical protein M3063_03810 [Actinomycetota bacterium]|nr:hypothetical protein [Actinomycetota bacterium]
MSTVVLPARSAGASFRTEADLARTAARSDRLAFDELYRRHSQTSWRLAQAVSPDRARAADAVAEGFTLVMRDLRRRRLNTETPFRPALLTEVYRAAMEQARTAKTGATTPANDAVAPPSSGSASPGTVAAFRSLPERWRAAVWLAEVEQLQMPAVATILGVSGPVAAQLVDRGRQGLLARFAQASITIPDHIGDALRPLAAAVPANMEVVAVKRWKGSVTVDPSGRLAPAADWLAEKAPRPLWVACGGLVALGMVGLGVLTVASSPATSGPAAAISAPAASGGAPVNPSMPGGHNNLLFGPGSGASGFLKGAGLSSGAGSLIPSVGAPTNPILIGEGSGANQATAPSGPAGPAASPGGSPTSPTSPGGGATTPPAPGNPATPVTGGPPAPKSIINVPGVIGATQPAGGGLGVTVGAPSAPTAGITLNPTCTGVQILNINLNTCQNPPAGDASTTVPSLLGGLLGGLGVK